MRLTYKYEKDDGYGSIKLKDLPQDPLGDRLSYINNTWEEQRNKLGQLEDIEEEFGIDLITLFKALKNGIWAKYKTQCNREQVIYLGMIPVRYYPTISLRNRELAFECDKQYWKLKDYGKTWALTREELEK